MSSEISNGRMTDLDVVRAGGGAATSPASDGALTARDSILAILLRRRWIIIAITVISLLGGYLYCRFTQRWWTGTAMLQVSPQMPVVLGNSNGTPVQSDTFMYQQATLAGSTPVIQSALGVVATTIAPAQRGDTALSVDSAQAVQLITQVGAAGHFRLIGSPAPKQHLASQDVTYSSVDVRGGIIHCQALTGPALEGSCIQLDDPRYPDLASMQTFDDYPDPIGYVNKYVDIEIGKKDGLLNISLDAANYKEAIFLVSSLVDAYKQYDVKLQEQSSDQLRTWVNSNIADLKRELDQKQAALVDFKQRHRDIVELNGPVTQKLQQLGAALTTARLDELSAKVDYQQANSQAWAYANLQKASQKVQALQAEYAKQEAVLLGLVGQQATLAQMVQEVDAVTRLWEALETRGNALMANNTGQALNVQIVLPAEAPLSASKPNRFHVFLATGMGGLLLGALLAWLVDISDHRLASADDVSQALGLPILGLIPRMPPRRAIAVHGQRVQTEEMSEVAEAFRTLRTVVYFSANDQCRTLLVTSPTQKDGKSTTTSGLAIAMAKAGRSTLLIDTDLRRPSLHRIFDIDNTTGLTSVLAGKESLETVVRHTAVEGLDALPCGPLPHNPSEILNGPAFADLLERLSHRYDHILLDSPPVLPVTDARILGALCDATIIVLRAGKTTRRASAHTCNAMLDVGAKVLGVVVNDVTRRRRAGYFGGVGYSGYGYVRGHDQSGSTNNGHGNGNGNGAAKPQLGDAVIEAEVN